MLYVKRMGLLRGIMRRVRDEGVLATAEVKGIFSETNAIVATHEEMLKKLQAD